MGKYIKLFNNHSQYETFIGGGGDTPFIEPNVSHCITENEVHYNPKRYYVVCTYNVADLTHPTHLYSDYYSKHAFDILYIDGVETQIRDLIRDEEHVSYVQYQFNTIGEHTVKFALSDKTVVPREIFGYTNDLIHITIPNSVERIEGYVFAGCRNLRSISIPEGVRSIGHRMCYWCNSLTTINIPSTVTDFGSEIFYDCTSLPIENNIRYGDTVLAAVVDNTLSTYTIKNGTIVIDELSFDSCKNLTSITIPNTVKHINDEAFFGCTSLANIDIPDSVTSIGVDVFVLCEGLTSITINALTPPALGENAFGNTNNCPIYVPTTSVNDYKTASGWSDYANRIQAIPTA